MRYTEQQYRRGHHFVAWLADTQETKASLTFLSNCNGRWIEQSDRDFVLRGMKSGWIDLPEGVNFWDNLDDEWNDHLTTCAGEIPEEYDLPAGAMKAINDVLDAVAALGEKDEDPDLEPIKMSTVTNGESGVLGEVRNMTPEAQVFLLWLTLEGRSPLTTEFLEFADEDWTANDMIDFVMLALDWASTAQGVRGWRRVSNHWRVYLVDNEGVNLKNMERSLYFLVWLREHHGDKSYIDFMDHSKEDWEDLPSNEYVNHGMDLWTKTELGLRKWQQIFIGWAEVLASD